MPFWHRRIAFVYSGLSDGAAITGTAHDTNSQTAENIVVSKLNFV